MKFVKSNKNNLILFISILFLSCEVFYPYEDDCGVIDGDNSSCADFCGVPNGDHSSCCGAGGCNIITDDIMYLDNNDYISSVMGDWKISETSYEGSQSLKSGNISHSQTSNITIVINTVDDTTLFFLYKVSSEGCCDVLEFYIDGVEELHEGGEIDWTIFQTSIVTGEHTLTWIYDKDSSVTIGSDASWIDNIRIF